MAEKTNAEAMAELINQYSEMFDTLCQERHEVGQEKYGVFTFLGNDIVRMAMEECADIANYARMHFVKLMFLQRQLEEEMGAVGIGQTNTPDIQIGWQPFAGTKDVGWDKS